MNKTQLLHQIHQKKSFLCVGLDPDIDRIPVKEGTVPERILTFNKAVIDATRDFCVAYKPNTAFYEMYGAAGWEILRETISYIGGDHFIIADAKRGDIGNTSRKYAAAFFETLHADAVTIAPYMGQDSVRPFLEYPGHWVILLGLTSNAGSANFQKQKLQSGDFLYEMVLRTASKWGNPDNMMFVIGATHPEEFLNVRKILPEHFLLVPGIGSQGGDFEAVCQYGMNDSVGLLINVSRGILYPDAPDGDWRAAVRREAKSYREKMAAMLALTSP